MRIAIIEDEELAVEKLEILLAKMDFPTTVVAKLDSVRAATAWFSTNSAPDLAFFDIQLADGVSFDIFEKVNVNCPVIFTTAYDEYARSGAEFVENQAVAARTESNLATIVVGKSILASKISSFSTASSSSSIMAILIKY